MSSEAWKTDPHQFVAQEPDAVAGPRAAPLSPVDQILAMPHEGRSLLDTRPAGAPVPRWMWLLPLILALPGGIVGWLLLRDSNRAGAWTMLVVGTIVTALTALTFGSLGEMLSSLGG